MTLISRIEPLALEGMKPQAIATELGVNKHYVRAAMCRLRKRGFPVPMHREPTAMPFPMQDDVKKRLRTAAEARKTTPRALACLIISTVMRDDLIAAVLDDSTGHGGVSG